MEENESGYKIIITYALYTRKQELKEANKFSLQK